MKFSCLNCDLRKSCNRYKQLKSEVYAYAKTRAKNTNEFRYLFSKLLWIETTREANRCGNYK
ncbi:MAG: hypothetical protein DRJ18_01460 [Candidatus Methanomethylicota archaeon]|nr:MAG: hypothetical protein DRJ18_01460 [Candidatus Verstraetearchaeota archaeon]